jgi:hypothetical protein
MGQMKRHAQFDSLADNLGFGTHQQRRPDLQRHSLHPRFRPFLDCDFERTDKFGPAVGIAGIVENVRAKVDDRSPHHLGMSRREREKDEVSSRHIGHRNPAASFLCISIFWHPGCGRQRRPAEGTQIEFQHQVMRRLQGLCDLTGPFDFHRVTLSIGHRQEEQFVAVMSRQCGNDSGIQPSTG